MSVRRSELQSDVSGGGVLKINLLFICLCSHLNAVVRKCTAQHLANLVEKVGAVRLLSGVKDLTDRIVPAVVKLSQDSSQEARWAASSRLLHFRA